jgi:hypothetical protein
MTWKLNMRFEFDSKLNTISNAYGDAIVKTLATNLRALGKSATGELIKSLKIDTKQSKGRTVIKLSAKTYLRWVDKGRKPGTFPNITAISKWVKLKGISERAVFPIARSIKEKGIKKTDVVSKSIKETEQRYKRTFEKELNKMVGVVIVNDIFNQTNTKGAIIPRGLRK